MSRTILILVVALVAAGAAGPSTRPALKMIEIPALVSPDAKEYAAGKDAAINRLIEAHNAAQDQIATALLRGSCVWNLEGNEGRPRGMRILYDRAAGSATMSCGNDVCSVKGAKVEASAEALVHTDALYLLMFRKYNPKGFVAMPAGKVGSKQIVVAKSDTETLEFDAESGRLVRATVPTKAGAVVVNLENYAAVAVGSDKVVLPTKIWLSVPDDFFPEGWANKAKITLTIGAAQSEVTRPAAR